MSPLVVVVVLVLAIPLVLVLLDLRPSSLRSRYRRDVAEHLAKGTRTRVVTEGDLARLPEEIATYLRRVGVVGKPRVHDFRVRFDVEMKSSDAAPWMHTTAEQYEFFDGPLPTRLFFMRARQKGVPFVGYHRFTEGVATMQIRVAGLLQVVDARGPEMNQSETVTLFNDMCVMAPATLVDADVSWERLAPRHLQATFHNGDVTIRAELFFDEAGDLVDFVSRDRFKSADGKTYERHPWQTPLGAYKDFHGVRLASKGDAIWKEPQGDLVYGRFTIADVAYNVAHTAVPPLALGLAR